MYIRTFNEDFDGLEDAPAVDNWDKISYINRPVEIFGEGKQNSSVYGEQSFDLCYSFIILRIFHLISYLPVSPFFPIVYMVSRLNDSHSQDFDSFFSALLSRQPICHFNLIIPVFSTAGKCFTLTDAMRTLLPELFPKKSLTDDIVCVSDMEDEQKSPAGEAGSTRITEETGGGEIVRDHLESLSMLDSAEIKLIRIQGIEPKMEIPFAWVVNNLMNPEHFIHICVYVKVQEPITL